MASEGLLNNYSDTLGANITSTSTTLQVTSTAALDSTKQYRLRIDQSSSFELVLVQVSDATHLTVVGGTSGRGIEGSTAASWTSGATVTIVLTADGLANWVIGDTAWIAVTYQNSWVDYGSGFPGVAYRKDALGFVHLRGLCKNGSSATATIFTLPAGYRPAGTSGSGGARFIADNHANAVGVDVGANGTVTVNSQFGSPDTTYQFLDGITFLAEQ